MVLIYGYYVSNRAHDLIGGIMKFEESIYTQRYLNQLEELLKDKLFGNIPNITYNENKSKMVKDVKLLRVGMHSFEINI